MKKRVRVLGMCGSLTPGSATLKALKASLEAARKSGAQTDLVQLRDYQLPLLNSPHAHENSKKHIRQIRKQCQEADAFLVASPEYHGSFTGALKNALDWMGFEEFEGKMIGLIGIAGGDMGAINTLNHLRVVFRQLHAWVLPDQVSISNSGKAFDNNGRPKNPQIAKRLHQLGMELTKFTLLHRQEKDSAFIKEWERNVLNPGGEGR